MKKLLLITTLCSVSLLPFASGFAGTDEYTVKVHKKFDAFPSHILVIKVDGKEKAWIKSVGNETKTFTVKKGNDLQIYYKMVNKESKSPIFNQKITKDTGLVCFREGLIPKCKVCKGADADC